MRCAGRAIQDVPDEPGDLEWRPRRLLWFPTARVPRGDTLMSNLLQAGNVLDETTRAYARLVGREWGVLTVAGTIRGVDTRARALGGQGPLAERTEAERAYRPVSLSRTEMQGIAVVSVGGTAMRWTDAPRGQVLEAFGRHVGSPVTVKDYRTPPREVVRAPPAYQPDLAALADRIVSGD